MSIVVKERIVETMEKKISIGSESRMEKDRELISVLVFFHLSGNYIPSTGNEKLPVATLGDDSNSAIFSPKSRK